MRFVSVADTKEYKLESNKELAQAVREYVTVSVEDLEKEQLQGVAVTILNLDKPEILIGSGIVREGDALHKIVSARVEMMVTDLKKQLLIGERYPEDYKEEDMTEIDSVINLGDYSAKKTATAIKQFALAAAKVSANMTIGMRSKIEKMYSKIADRAGNNGCALYEETWIKRFIDQKLNNSSDITDSEKALMKSIIGLTKMLMDAGVNTMADLNTLNGGLYVKAYGIKYLGGRRAATVSEIEKHVGNLFMGTANMLDDLDTYRWLCFMTVATGNWNIRYSIDRLENSELIKKQGNKWFSKFYKNENIEGMVTRNIGIIISRVEELKGKLSFVLGQLKTGLKQINYPTEVKPTERYVVAVAYTLEDMFNRILADKKPNKYNETAHKIAAQCVKEGKFELSEKQLDVVMRAYTSYISEDSSMDRTTDEDRISTAKKLLSEYGDKLNKTVKAIAATVVEKGCCTAKQFSVIKEVYDRLKSDNNSIMLDGGADASDIIDLINKNEKVSNVKKSEVESNKVEEKKSATNIPKPMTAAVDTADEDDIKQLIDTWFN